jgi:hypothetical protein
VDGRLIQLEADTLATIGLPFPGTNGIVCWLKIDNAG